jgi:hypothetical protein
LGLASSTAPPTLLNPFRRRSKASFGSHCPAFDSTHCCNASRASMKALVRNRVPLWSFIYLFNNFVNSWKFCTCHLRPMLLCRAVRVTALTCTKSIIRIDMA